MIWTCPDVCTFDGPDIEADDVNETVTWYDIFTATVGG